LTVARGVVWLLLVLGAAACRRPAPEARWSPPFRCAGELCVQAHPRLPDDGEWECADMAGAAICRGGDPPAGVAPGPPDPSWTCGARAGAKERVCVDLRADFPEGRAAGWRCRYDHAPAPRRACARDPGAHNLGDPCARERPCVDGARCVDGRCVADQGLPSCWLDEDCPHGACRFGACVRGAS
jgi:hypothetical protein